MHTHLESDQAYCCSTIEIGKESSLSDGTILQCIVLFRSLVYHLLLSFCEVCLFPNTPRAQPSNKPMQLHPQHRPHYLCHTFLPISFSFPTLHHHSKPAGVTPKPTQNTSIPPRHTSEIFYRFEAFPAQRLEEWQRERRRYEVSICELGCLHH